MASPELRTTGIAFHVILADREARTRVEVAPDDGAGNPDTANSETLRILPPGESLVVDYRPLLADAGVNANVFHYRARHERDNYTDSDWTTWSARRAATLPDEFPPAPTGIETPLVDEDVEETDTTGTLKLTVYDKHEGNLTVNFWTRSGKGTSFGTVDQRTGVADGSTVSKQVSLVEKHHSYIQYEVIGSNGESAGKKVVEFDPDSSADIQIDSQTVENQQALIKITGDSDTVSIWRKPKGDPDGNAVEVISARQGIDTIAQTTSEQVFEYAGKNADGRFGTFVEVSVPSLIPSNITEPAVHENPSFSGSTGTLTLVIDDPDSTVDGVFFAKKEGPGDFGAFAEDTTAPYEESVALAEKHNDAIKWRVDYTMAGFSFSKGGSYTFDLDEIAKVEAFSVNVDSNGNIFVSGRGDADTATIYFTIASDGTEPVDPTAANADFTYDAATNGRVFKNEDTGANATALSIIRVKARAENGSGVLSPVETIMEATTVYFAWSGADLPRLPGGDTLDRSFLKASPSDNDNLDSVPDGTTYGRVDGGYLDTNRPSRIRDSTGGRDIPGGEVFAKPSAGDPDDLSSVPQTSTIKHTKIDTDANRPGSPSDGDVFVARDGGTNSFPTIEYYDSGAAAWQKAGAAEFADIQNRLLDDIEGGTLTKGLIQDTSGSIGIRLDPDDALPAWTYYMDFTADQAGEFFIKHASVELEGNGDATFAGEISASSLVFVDGDVKFTTAGSLGDPRAQLDETGLTVEDVALSEEAVYGRQSITFRGDLSYAFLGRILAGDSGSDSRPKMSDGADSSNDPKIAGCEVSSGSASGDYPLGTFWYETDTDTLSIYDGSAWNTISSGGTVSTLNDLSDVNLSSPASNEALVYNGTNWVNDAGVVFDDTAETITGSWAFQGQFNKQNTNMGLADDIGIDFGLGDDFTLLYDSTSGDWELVHTTNGNVFVVSPTGNITMGGGSISAGGDLSLPDGGLSWGGGATLSSSNNVIATDANADITGNWNYDTDNGNNPFWFSRLGANEEALVIRVTDRDLELEYLEDSGEAAPGSWSFLSSVDGGSSYEWLSVSAGGPPVVNIGLSSSNVNLNGTVQVGTATGDADTTLRAEHSIAVDNTGSTTNYGYFAVWNDNGRGAYWGWGDGSSVVDMFLDTASTLRISGGDLVVGTDPGGGEELRVGGRLRTDNGATIQGGANADALLVEDSGAVNLFRVRESNGAVRMGNPLLVGGVDATERGDHQDGLKQVWRGGTSELQMYVQGGHGRVGLAWNAEYNSSAGAWEGLVGSEDHAIITLVNNNPGAGTGNGGVGLHGASAAGAGGTISWNTALQTYQNGDVDVGDDGGFVLPVGTDRWATNT